MDKKKGLCKRFRKKFLGASALSIFNLLLQDTEGANYYSNGAAATNAATNWVDSATNGNSYAVAPSINDTLFFNGNHTITIRGASAPYTAAGTGNVFKIAINNPYTGAISVGDTASYTISNITTTNSGTITLSYGSAGSIDLGANLLTGNVSFSGRNGTLSLSSGTISGTINGGASNFGILSLSGTPSVTGAIGPTTRLAAVNLANGTNFIQNSNLASTQVNMNGNSNLTTNGVLGMGTVSINSGTLTINNSTIGVGGGSTNIKFLDDGLVNSTNTNFNIKNITTSSAGTGNIKLENTVTTFFSNVGTSTLPIKTFAWDTQTLTIPGSAAVYANTIDGAAGSSLLITATSGVLLSGNIGPNTKISLSNGSVILSISENSVCTATIDGSGSNQGILNITPGAGKTVALLSGIGQTKKLSSFTMDIGTLNIGTSVTSATTSFVGDGSISLGANTLTSDIDFGGKNGTISIGALGVISGTVDNSVSVSGSVLISGSGATISGNIGGTNQIASIDFGGNFNTSLSGSTINVANITANSNNTGTLSLLSANGTTFTGSAGSANTSLNTVNWTSGKTLTLGSGNTSASI
ncbi:MAG: hypothetical protein SFT91_03145, partial [Rickettsiaceae bacterium]|nr:hypothetical protein [Rickettsiaceae bacterium]